jgi:hypothetical protein
MGISVDPQEEIRDAWAKVRIPDEIVAKYGAFRLWDYDGRLSRPHYVLGAIVDRECLWVVATRGDGTNTCAGLTFNRRAPLESFLDVSTHLQTMVDQWEQVSHPLKEGDILPEPRNLYYEQTQDGQIRAIEQPVMMHWTLNGRSFVYYYDRSKYRLERVSDMCDETQEAFRLIDINS